MRRWKPWCTAAKRWDDALDVGPQPVQDAVADAEVRDVAVGLVDISTSYLSYPTGH